MLQADNLISVLDVDATSIVVSHRLTPLNTPPLDKMSHVHFTLQEIIIVGNTHEQVCNNAINLEDRKLEIYFTMIIASNIFTSGVVALISFYIKLETYL